MKTLSHQTVSLGVTMAVLCSGCGSSTYSESHSLYRGPLDDRYDLWLTHASTKRINHTPLLEEREESMTVSIEPRPLKSAHYTLKSVEVDRWPSWSHFDFQNVEARVDADGRYIWFIDREGGTVIGSVDRVTGQTTGPGDQPPEWATLDGGQRLVPQ